MQDVGIRVGVDGEAAFNASLQNIVSKSKELSSELKNVAQQMSGTDKSTDGLRAKIDVLNRSVANQEKYIESLRKKYDSQKKALDETAKEYDEAKKTYGENSAEVEKLSAKYQRQEAQLNRTKTSINKAETALDQMNRELKENQDALSKAESWTAKLEAAQTKLKKASEAMTKVGKQLTTKVTLPIIAGFTAASKSASDYEENMNKIDVAFGDSADAVKEWTKTATTQFGLSWNAASEAAAGFGALAKGLGLSEEEAAYMSTTLAGLSADLGSYFNMGTDETATALNGIFTGEAEALKKVGVVMNETELKKYADGQGLVWKEMSSAEKAALRFQYVLDQTKDAQGDYARTGEGTANSVKSLKAQLENCATVLGEKLLPIITPVIQKLADIAEKFSQLSPETQDFIVKFGMIAAVVGPALVAFGSLAGAVSNIIGLGTKLAPVLAGLGLPFGTIALAVAGAVAAGVLLYKNWDKIKEAAKQLKDFLGKRWGEIKNEAVDYFSTMKTSVVTTFESFRSSLSEKVDAVNKKVSDVFGTIKETISGPFVKAYSIVKGAIDDIKGLLSGTKLELPKIKMPHFSWKMEDVGGVLKLPKISVSWYDKGGVFKNPSIIGVGEKRPEFVGALDDLRKIVREETGGMTINVYGTAGMDENMLAEKVMQKMQQNLNRRRFANGLV